MYSLKDFTLYTGQQISSSHKVLAWSKKDGYYFTRYGLCGSGVKVIAMEE